LLLRNISFVTSYLAANGRGRSPYCTRDLKTPTSSEICPQSTVCIRLIMILVMPYSSCTPDLRFPIFRLWKLYSFGKTNELNSYNALRCHHVGSCCWCRWSSSCCWPAARRSSVDDVKHEYESSSVNSENYYFNLNIWFYILFFYEFIFLSKCFNLNSENWYLNLKYVIWIHKLLFAFQKFIFELLRWYMDLKTDILIQPRNTVALANFVACCQYQRTICPPWSTSRLMDSLVPNKPKRH
jgi:hypothetical protein